MLFAWWVSCSAVTWRVAHPVPVLVGVSMVAATVFVVVLWRCSPRRGAVRLTAYLAALVATQAPPAMSAFVPLLPGHHLHKVPETASELVSKAASAVVAVSTFLLVRAWVSEDGRRADELLPRWLRPWPRHNATSMGATAALVCVSAMIGADMAQAVSGYVLDIELSSYPQEPDQLGAWALAMATGGLAGAVEEPVYVGLLAALWPRPGPKAFIALALLGGAARSTIHLYYAAGAAPLAAAVIVVVLWCLLWSSASLYLVYCTRMLWPVIVAHGLSNQLMDLNGLFDQGDGGLWGMAIVMVPVLTLLGLAVAAEPYASARCAALRSHLVETHRNWKRRRAAKLDGGS